MSHPTHTLTVSIHGRVPLPSNEGCGPAGLRTTVDDRGRRVNDDDRGQRQTTRGEGGGGGWRVKGRPGSGRSNRYAPRSLPYPSSDHSKQSSRCAARAHAAHAPATPLSPSPKLPRGLAGTGAFLALPQPFPHAQNRTRPRRLCSACPRPCARWAPPRRYSHPRPRRCRRPRVCFRGCRPRCRRTRSASGGGRGTACPSWRKSLTAPASPEPPRSPGM
jgi:hypothetical protein